MHTNIKPLKKVTKIINGQKIEFELFPDDRKDTKYLDEKILI